MNAMILVLFIFLSACNYKSTKSGALILTPTSQGTNQITNSFAVIKTNIIDAKCLRCHSGPSGQAGIDLSNYASIMASPGLVTASNAATSLLFTEVQSGSMPLGSTALGTNELKLIQDWINNGAPNGDFAANPPTPSVPDVSPTPDPPVSPIQPPTPIPAPPASTASYADVQTKIFNQSCLRCHSGESPAANINLTTYDFVMANNDPKAIEPGNSADSLVYNEIQSGRMPPRGVKVSPELVEVLKNWIDQGAANN